MFSEILIANRGEIAIRIIRACRKIGIRTVAVFSEADRKALPVLKADEAYPIGAAPAAESYLRIDKILDAARKSFFRRILHFPDFVQGRLDTRLIERFFDWQKDWQKQQDANPVADADVTRALAITALLYHSKSRTEPEGTRKSRAAIAVPVEGGRAGGSTSMRLQRNFVSH